MTLCVLAEPSSSAKNAGSTLKVLNYSHVLVDVIIATLGISWK